MMYATKGAPSEYHQCADVLVPRKGYSYQTDREPLPH